MADQGLSNSPSGDINGLLFEDSVSGKGSVGDEYSSGKFENDEDGDSISTGNMMDSFLKNAESKMSSKQKEMKAKFQEEAVEKRIHEEKHEEKGALSDKNSKKRGKEKEGMSIGISGEEEDEYGDDPFDTLSPSTSIKGSSKKSAPSASFAMDSPGAAEEKEDKQARLDSAKKKAKGVSFDAKIEESPSPKKITRRPTSALPRSSPISSQLAEAEGSDSQFSTSTKARPVSAGTPLSNCRDIRDRDISLYRSNLSRC